MHFLIQKGLFLLLHKHLFASFPAVCDSSAARICAVQCNPDWLRMQWSLKIITKSEMSTIFALYYYSVSLKKNVNITEVPCHVLRFQRSIKNSAHVFIACVFSPEVQILCSNAWQLLWMFSMWATLENHVKDGNHFQHTKENKL